MISLSLSLSLWMILIIYTDACENINCNYGRCIVNQHDGTPYCDCLPGYTGSLCLEKLRGDDFRE
jgi:hypothetical protein